MGLGWLLVPALGGYWLLTHLRITRFSVLRDSGYHVFFRAATAGGLLVVIAYALVQCMTWAFPEVDSLWRRVVPFEYSGTFMLSAVLGFLLPPLINLFYRDVMGAFPISRSRAHTHRRHGHPLQTVPSAGLIERPQEKNRVDALR